MPSPPAEDRPARPSRPSPDSLAPTRPAWAPDPQATLPATPGGRFPSPSGTVITTVAGAAAEPRSLEGWQLDDFFIERTLGQGGMGTVYLGQQVSLQRPVAVKVLPGAVAENPDFIERFQREARSVARFSSPHVVQVYGAGSALGVHYFAMEYVEGADLAAHLKHGWRPTPSEALELIIQAASGLADAHEAGLIHRDIKPHNLMVDGRGRLKIMDFGLVHLDNESHGLTRAGSIMGTVSYLSPEQGRGEPCDARTDLYALGVVFFELLTGELPFRGGDPGSIIYQHIHEPVPALSESNPAVPEDMQAVVLKCLQKSPEDRYRHARELLGDLQRLQAGLPPLVALRDQRLLRAGGLHPRKVPLGGQRVLLRVVLVASLLGASGYWLYRERQAVRTWLDTQGLLPVAWRGEAPLAERVRSLLAAGDIRGAKALLVASPQAPDYGAAQRLLQQAEQKHTSAVALSAQELAALASRTQEALDSAALASVPALIAQFPPAEQPAWQERLRKAQEAQQQRDSQETVWKQALEAGQPEAVLHSEPPAPEALRQRAQAMRDYHALAQAALAQDDLVTASDILARSLATQPNAVARSGVAAVSALRAALVALEAGDPALASARYQHAVVQLPDGFTPPQTIALRVQLAQAVALAEAAMAQGSPQVEQYVQAVGELPGGKPQAERLTKQWALLQVRAQVSQAQAAGDYGALTMALERWRTLAPSDPELLSLLQQREQTAKAAQQAAAEARAAYWKDLLARVKNPETDLQAVTAAMKQAANGEQGPIPSVVELAWLERQRRHSAEVWVKQFDHDLVRGSAHLWLEQPDLQRAFGQLAQEPQLLWQSQVQAVSDVDGLLRVTCVVRHAYQYYPERKLQLTWWLRPQGERWIATRLDVHKDTQP